MAVVGKKNRENIMEPLDQLKRFLVSWRLVGGLHWENLDS